MNRRDLLKWLGLAPALPLAASLPAIAEVPQPIGRPPKTHGVTKLKSNAKLIQFTKEINAEFIRESHFAPYWKYDARTRRSGGR